MARAGQGVGAGPSLRALGLALAASLLAHGALLAALPRSWEPASGLSPQRPEPLRVSLMRAPAEPLSTRPASAPRPAAGLPFAPRYFAAHELERRPQILSQVEPQFPALALAPTGRVVLRLYVDEGGRVDRIGVEADDPNGAFAAAAREAFAAARFMPGMKDGMPVKALLRIEVLFGSPHPDNTRP